MFSADALLPGGADGDGAQSALDDLVEKSHKHAVGVSKELRSGIRESIEILANEVIAQRIAGNKAVYDGPNRVDAKVLTTQCLGVYLHGCWCCSTPSPVRAGHRAHQR
ncbi:MAG: hypothetical protein IPH81_20145 [Candidatus Microthrix sp.]|nr:hypothetical protein [Candidatus Microthrix sp.]